MKRLGKTSNIIGQICAYDNISNSIDVVLRGRKRKRSRVGRYILKHRDEIISKLQKEIREGTFCVTQYHEYLVKDGPKVRRVQSVNMYERIGCNAIMHIVEAYALRRYIRTTGSSIKGRGMHDLRKYIQKDIMLDPEGTAFGYKFDLKKFYESIYQDFMMYALRRMFKDRILLTILERFVRMMPKGLSIGLRSSQGFGNILLSMFLDHYLKDKMGIKHFYRYCDDGLALAKDKKTLWKIRDVVHNRAEFMMLDVKHDERVFPRKEGIDFLGYVTYGSDFSKLRKRNKQNAARKLHKLKSKKRIAEVTASLYGQCKHANCRNLFYRLTEMTMSEYVRLSETKIKEKAHKKAIEKGQWFEGETIRMSELVGEEFLVRKFKKNVVTNKQRKAYSEKLSMSKRQLELYTMQGIAPPQGFIYPNEIELPRGKYLVSIVRNPGNIKCSLRKFFTGDFENMEILDQMQKEGLIGRTLCTLSPVLESDGFTRYVLS